MFTLTFCFFLSLRSPLWRLALRSLGTAQTAGRKKPSSWKKEEKHLRNWLPIKTNKTTTLLQPFCWTCAFDPLHRCYFRKRLSIFLDLLCFMFRTFWDSFRSTHRTKNKSKSLVVFVFFNHILSQFFKTKKFWYLFTEETQYCAVSLHLYVKISCVHRLWIHFLVYFCNNVSWFLFF